MSEEQDIQSSSMSDDSSDDESPKSGTSLAVNPFFDKKKRPKVDNDKSKDSDSESNSSDFSDSDDDVDDDSDLSEDEKSDVVKEEPEVDEEDPLIQALKKSKEKPERKSPPDLSCPDMITDLSFHPGSNLIAHCDINGKIYLNEYANEENTKKAKQKCHNNESVRSLEFNHTGNYLISGGADKSFQIMDTETFKLISKVSDAHEVPLYKVKAINENLIATGDEDGTVKLWDKRLCSNMTKSVMEDSNSLDGEVSDFFHTNQDPNYLVASSGEGIIQGYNLAGKKPDMQSEVYEGAMNCMAVVHRDSKLIVGCDDGKLYMFNWREFGHWSDRFPGHPGTINSILAVTDNVVITACEDGSIRALHLYPHRFVGTVGIHKKNAAVDKLDVSHDGGLIASISSEDESVKFWNIKYLEEMDYNKTKKPFLQQKGHTKMRRKDNKMQRAQESEFQLPSSNRANQKDFFKDLDE